MEDRSKRTLAANPGRNFWQDNVISGADFAAQPCYVVSACNDEFMDNAFAFCRENGLCAEASYSYITTRGSCKDSSCNVDIVQGSVTGNKDVSTVGERTPMSAVARQPVSTAIEADLCSFQLYISGVLCSRGMSVEVRLVRTSAGKAR